MPPPTVSPLNEGMWRAAAEGRLAVQRCDSCGSHRYPPTDGCYHCDGLEWSWVDLPGTGFVYSYFWVPAAGRPDDERRFYNVAVVELDGTDGDPVRIVSNVVDAWSVGEITIGQRVELQTVRLSDDVGLPCFRRAEP